MVLRIQKPLVLPQRELLCYAVFFLGLPVGVESDTLQTVEVCGIVGAVTVVPVQCSMVTVPAVELIILSLNSRIYSASLLTPYGHHCFLCHCTMFVPDGNVFSPHLVIAKV
uniref:Putative secreted protein n=1 Tax=Amblyomma tuberculatum TaxID=48802 RepID=A0A6M2E5U4_9ACAR